MDWRVIRAAYHIKEMHIFWGVMQVEVDLATVLARRQIEDDDTAVQQLLPVCFRCGGCGELPFVQVVLLANHFETAVFYP